MENRIKLRELRGFDITQNQLASELGFASNVYISRVERGHAIPTDKWMQKVEDAVKRIRARKLNQS